MLIAPFFRAAVTIGPFERRLFARGVNAAEWLQGLQAAHPILRQNYRRLFAAARLAETMGGRLTLVEGFRGNRVVRAQTADRFVTGSWVFALMLHALRRRGVLGAGRAPLRANVSRCTSEEAEAIAALAAGDRVVGVTSLPCPSAARTRRYLAAVSSSATVLTPEEALARTPPPGRDAADFWQATAPRRGEAWLAPVVEAPNWVVHGLSEAVRLLVRHGSLERRLAHVLRPDRAR